MNQEIEDIAKELFRKVCIKVLLNPDKDEHITNWVYNQYKSKYIERAKIIHRRNKINKIITKI